MLSAQPLKFPQRDYHYRRRRRRRRLVPDGLQLLQQACRRKIEAVPLLVPAHRLNGHHTHLRLPAVLRTALRPRLLTSRVLTQSSLSRLLPNRPRRCSLTRVVEIGSNGKRIEDLANSNPQRPDCPYSTHFMCGSCFLALSTAALCFDILFFIAVSCIEVVIMLCSDLPSSRLHIATTECSEATLSHASTHSFSISEMTFRENDSIDEGLNYFIDDLATNCSGANCEEDQSNCARSS